MKIQNCSCTINSNVIVFGDYIGNIYLKSPNNLYYYLYISSNCIQLISLSNSIICKLKQHLADNIHVKKYVRYGNITPREESLRGKAMTAMKKYNNSAKSSLNYSSFDDTFIERCYYSVTFDKNNNKNDDDDGDDDDDDDDDDNENDNYDINGIANDSYSDETNEKIHIANFMMESPGTYDTIFINGDIESKHVTSTIEKANGCSPIRLTIYSTGIFKVNIIGESINYYKLMCNNNIDNHELFAQ